MPYDITLVIAALGYLFSSQSPLPLNSLLSTSSLGVHRNFWPLPHHTRTQTGYTIGQMLLSLLEYPVTYLTPLPCARTKNQKGDEGSNMSPPTSPYNPLVPEGVNLGFLVS